MMWNRYAEQIHVIDTDRSLADDALLLGGFLAAGLTFVVPLLSLMTPVPTLVSLGVVGLLYGVVAMVIGRVSVGIYLALLVTMTFVANVPLASDAYLRSMTRDLGPSIWLAQIPLFALLGILAFRDREQFVRISRAEAFLGAFVGWVVVAAFVVRPLRLDAALFFALFVFWGGLVFAAVRRAHRILAIPPKTALGVLACTVLFKSCFALVEAVNGASFGLTRLGEISPAFAIRIATLPLGPVSLSVGTFVSGFTGMSFLLASLVVLLVPFLLVRVLDGVTPIRIAGALSAFLMLLALRLTGTDAGRGAVLLALATFLVGVVWITTTSSTIDRRRMVAFLAVVLVCVGLILLPSTQSGAASEGVAAASSAVGGGTATGNVDAAGIAVPLFDLSNLGIRLSQYVAGVSLFLEQPIFGIGGANFPYVGAAYGIPDNLPIHNVYISLLAETGLVGFLLYAGFLVSVLYRGVVTVKTVPRADSLVYLAALAGIVGYLGFMFWDHMLFNSIASSFTFYAVCAALVAGRCPE